MSWDWTDRDLLEWAQKTLPEFLLIAMQDPTNRDKCIAKTPWQDFEVSVAEVQVEGECNLIGKRNDSFFQFDLDIGMRVDIVKPAKKNSKAAASQAEEQPDRRNGVVAFSDRRQRPQGEVVHEEDSYWPGLAQMAHFENQNMQPKLSFQVEDVPTEISEEVDWYLLNGMGRLYIWHGLARWHAYAVKKWLKQSPPAIRDPYRYPEPPPAFPPFKEAERRAHLEEVIAELLREEDGGGEAAAGGLQEDIRRTERALQLVAGSQPRIGRKPADLDQQDYVSPPVSDEEDFEPWQPYEYDQYTMERRRRGAPPKMKKFGRYPFLPSMLGGVGGPSTEWLRPKQFAIAHPEQLLSTIKDREGKALAGGVTHMDVIRDKAMKKREAIEDAAQGRLVAARATELCQAIEQGEVMRAFAKLDDQTVNCPRRENGRCAAHCCVAQGARELLQMVIAARADLNAKDAFGQTPLMMAARQGDAELSRLLLDGGADPTQEDPLGRSASDMVKVLPVQEDHPLKNWKAKMSGDPIPEDPAKKSHELKDLIDAKERPRKYGAMLLTALEHKDVRTAEANIEAGADVNLTDARGDSALVLLAKGKWKDQEGLQVRLAQKIHRVGANINFKNVQGNTPLLFAAHRGSLQLVEALLELKADASLVNVEGNTALMYAAHGGYEGICTALLEAFSPVTQKNKFGLTAEVMAQRRGFKSCAVLIHAYELAPKKSAVEDAPGRRKDKQKKEAKMAFDYSKWDALEKEMQQDEQLEEQERMQDAQKAYKRPSPKIEDLGPEAFGLPPDTPWPPADPYASGAKKGAFDYSRWDKIVDDIEKHDKVVERYEHLQKNPQYEWRNGQKLQVIF